MTQKNSIDFDQVVKQANQLPVSTISPELAKETITEEQRAQFIKSVADTHGISDAEAFIAISLLFLKGACNAAAPKTMSVDIYSPESGSGKPVSITKYDIEYACHLTTGNIFLRRFAQAMAPQISNYAEINNLNGDLAIRLNNLALSKGGTPLTTKEKAWASSFCQNSPELSAQAGDRLVELLAEDFQKRFGGKQSKKKTGPSGKDQVPREWRKGNPQNQKKREQEKAQSEEEAPASQKPKPKAAAKAAAKAAPKASAKRRPKS